MSNTCANVPEMKTIRATIGNDEPNNLFGSKEKNCRGRGFGKIVEPFPGRIVMANHFEELISRAPSTIPGGSPLLSNLHEEKGEGGMNPIVFQSIILICRSQRRGRWGELVSVPMISFPEPARLE